MLPKTPISTSPKICKDHMLILDLEFYVIKFGFQNETKIIILKK